MTQKKTITQKDVAELAGVSRGVVSYVINNGPREVSAETRERVLAAIQELGYRPNKHAQRLKMGEAQASESLGIVAGGQSFNVLERPYYNIIMAGLFEEAHRLGQGKANKALSRNPGFRRKIIGSPKNFHGNNCKTLFFCSI